MAKKKTKVAKKTCDPLYQQALLFDEGPQGKVLQVSVYRVVALQVQVKHQSILHHLFYYCGGTLVQGAHV